jgi:hypothetical protein
VEVVGEDVLGHGGEHRRVGVRLDRDPPGRL